MSKCLPLYDKHDWELSLDQSGTGKMGVRMECRNCYDTTTEFNPKLHRQLAKSRGENTSE